MGDEVTTKIRAYLTRRFPGFDLGNDDDILTTGWVNSLVATEMAAYVQREFGIKLTSTDLVMDSFRTINTLSRLVERRR